EAIKWPELNAHGDGPQPPLATNRTGGAGFETSSQLNLAIQRPDSRAGSVAPSTMGGSSVELFAAGRDPYAVPPLPHMNPNMPYRDDPSQVYYDNEPYGAAAAPPPESIPMSQMRARSPGPQMAYGYPTDGRVSPGPQQALGGNNLRTASPGPQASLYSAPGPQAGRMSPGPQQAYQPGPGY
ncbi:uncharacterized protein BXZ73DRAFT_38218, partial [Epithele typhae]|uniref:uncharacterized protein n=1 Tax=Epithele typhae TaxID=378194 RepID=UPI002007EA7E